jgi:Flp pilus assembly protein TadG
MTITLNRIAAFRRSTAGATAVEFALAAPILFLLMFAIIEFGRAWWAKNSLQYAVERAARYAVVCDPKAVPPAPCPSVSQVTTFAASQAYGQSASSAEFKVVPETLVSGQTVTCVQYTYQFTPWFVGDYAPLAGAMTFKGTSCREIQPPL